MKKITKIMTQTMKKKAKKYLKNNFKTFRCNPNDPNFDLFKFVGEINLHISKLREKNVVNGVINKITEDFEKIVAVTKSKELKRYCQKHFNKLQKMKNAQSEIKPMKIGKRLGTTYFLGFKDFTHNFRPQEVKVTNRVLREKSVLFVSQIS